jgi:transposase InsO family protein
VATVHREVNRWLFNLPLGICTKQIQGSSVDERAFIRSKMKEKIKITTNSEHKYHISQNLVNKDFLIIYQNEPWIPDITYFRTREGWLYFTANLDVFI